MTDDTSDRPELPFSSIRYFDCDEMLMAEFEANALEFALNETTLIELLETSGYDKQQLDEETLLILVENSKNNHQGQLSLRPHIDATFELTIDKDQMNASIKVKIADGGTELVYEDVLETILESAIHIDYLKTDLLKSCLNKEQDEAVLIAQGIEPIRGIDASFEVLFNTNTKKVLNHCGDETVNHYETHEYITIAENQAVMKRIPFTKGIKGTTINGDDVAAEDGTHMNFTLDETVKVDVNNQDLLLAAKKGHPIASTSGVHIDDTLTVKDADLRSGNIHFDGSVYVTGEVHPNVVIEASGDIHINGMVENATLISGNDITLSAGVLSSKLYDNDDAYVPDCTIKAGGTLIMKYCNSIKASAKNDIIIEIYSMHSQLAAGKHLNFGHNNGKGAVIGGTAFAQYSINANLMGSEAYIKTTVECGPLRELKRVRKKTLGKLVRTQSEYSLLSNILEKIKNQGTPSTVGKVILKKAKKIHHEVKIIEQNIVQLEQQLELIKKQLTLTENANITINKKLYPNVHLTLNDVHHVNNREHDPCTIHSEGYEIHFN